MLWQVTSTLYFKGMKNKLPTLSVFIGIFSWSVCLAGIIYFEKFYSVENQDPLSIFEPGAFESVVILLSGAVITGIGFILGIFSFKMSEKRKISSAAIIINGIYCIPVAILLMLQGIQ